ncbi:MAG TPA: acetamidase/formamidase family protein [Syntrophomonadaceae bacterium]|nr:acetamidase/formamidase family protein [Syntrophomonadaceae bacterium]
MYQLDCTTTIFKFTSSNPLALQVPSGATVEIETQDCFANQIQTPEDRLDSMDWGRVNPATGPIFIEGAAPGDVLKVEILDIKLAAQGVAAAGEGLGPLGTQMQGLTSKLIPIKDEKAVFGNQLKIPLKPMIGVIGVAPAGEEINCGTPGPHGGNMDNTMMGAGATVYFPIFTPGALFALGDVHAVMGDGEIGGTGVEIPARITVRLHVMKGFTLENPVLENADYFTTIASAPTLDEAVDRSVQDMASILSRIGLSLPDITMLMSIAGHTQICQVVDPLRTARYVMPKWILAKYNFKF